MATGAFVREGARRLRRNSRYSCLRENIAAQLFAFATAQIQKQTVCVPFDQANLHETNRFDPGIQVPQELFSSL